MSVQQILTEYSGYFSISSLFKDVFRWLGWGIITALRWVCDRVETAVDQVLQLGGLISSSSITSFYNSYKVIIWVILAASIMFIGFLIMFNKVQSRVSVFQNLMIAIIVVFLLPTALLQFNSLISQGYKTFKTQSTSTSSTIISSNIIDLAKTTNFAQPTTKNYSDKQIDNFSYNEQVKPDAAGYKNLSNAELFKKKVITDANDNIQLVDLEDAFFDMFDEHYYRYSINFGTIIITLGVVSFVFIFTGIQIARLLFELIFHEFFATVIAFADIHSGQKFKAVIQSLLSTGFTIIFMAVLLRLYILAASFVGNLQNSSSFGTVAYLLAMIGLSFAVIDGPNIVERILGVDAGLKSPFRTFIVAKTAARAVTNVGKKLGHDIYNKQGPIGRAKNEKYRQQRLTEERKQATAAKKANKAKGLGSSVNNNNSNNSQNMSGASQQDANNNSDNGQSRVNDTQPETNNNSDNGQSRVNNPQQDTKNNSGGSQSRVNNPQQDTKNNSGGSQSRVNNPQQDTKNNSGGSQSRVNNPQQDTNSYQTHAQASGVYSSSVNSNNNDKASVNDYVPPTPKKNNSSNDSHRLNQTSEMQHNKNQAEFNKLQNPKSTTNQHTNPQNHSAPQARPPRTYNIPQNKSYRTKGVNDGVPNTESHKKG